MKDYWSLLVVFFVKVYLQGEVIFIYFVTILGQFS